MSSKGARGAVFWTVAIVTALFGYFTYAGAQPRQERISARELADDVRAGRVARIVAVRGHSLEVFGPARTGEPRRLRLTDAPDVFAALRYGGIDPPASGVYIDVRMPDDQVHTPRALRAYLLGGAFVLTALSIGRVVYGAYVPAPGARRGGAG